MVKSDILLDDQNIDAIPADGSFNLTTGTDEDPDIRFDPDDASLQLGDGGGSSSVGRTKLFDADGNQRVFLTARALAPPSGERKENAVFLSDNVEDAGVLVLSRVGEEFRNATVTLDAGASQLTLGSETGAGVVRMYGPALANTIDLDAADAEVRVGGTDVNGDNGVSGIVEIENDDGNETATLTSDRTNGGGGLSVGDASGARTAALDGDTGTLRLGRGSANVSGAVEIENDAGNQTVTITGDGSNGSGAGLSVGNASGTETADLDGGTGGLRLGSGAADVSGTVELTNSAGNRTVSLTSDQSSGSGSGLTLGEEDGTTTARIDGGQALMELGSADENGTLSLEDGAGMVVDLEAEDGSVTLAHNDPSKGEISLELEPENGVFSVVDGNGDPVFRVDTQEQSIEKARGYSRGVIGTGKPDNPGKGNGGPGGN